MPQYLLNIIQPVGEVPPPEVLEPVMRELAALNEEMQRGRGLGVRRRAAPAGDSTVVRADGDGVLVTDGPYAEGKEFIGGFDLIEADDLDGALAWAGKLARALGGLPDRGPPGRRALLTWPTGDRAGLPRALRPGGRRPGPPPRRHRRRRGGGAGRLRHRRAALAGRRRPAEPGRLDRHDRPQPGHRPLRREAARDDRHAEAALLRAPDRARGGRRRARRPAPADLHLLPPGARRRPRRWR